MKKKILYFDNLVFQKERESGEKISLKGRVYSLHLTTRGTVREREKIFLYILKKINSFTNDMLMTSQLTHQGL